MKKNVYIGVARLELHIPEARSLKQKRRSTRSLIERIRNRHQVQVIEADHQDLYQRAEFAISAISTDPSNPAIRLFSTFCPWLTSGTSCRTNSSIASFPTSGV